MEIFQEYEIESKVWYLCSDSAPNMIKGKFDDLICLSIFGLCNSGIVKDLNLIAPEILEQLEEEEEIEIDDYETLDVQLGDESSEMEKVQENVEELELHLDSQRLVRSSRTKYKRIRCTAHVINLCKFVSFNVLNYNIFI